MILLELIRDGSVADREKLQEVFLDHLAAVIEADEEDQYSSTTSALLEAVIAAYRDEAQAEDREPVILGIRESEKCMMDAFHGAYQATMRTNVDRSVTDDAWWTYDELYKAMPRPLARAIGRMLGVREARRAKSVAKFFEKEKSEQT